MINSLVKERIKKALGNDTNILRLRDRSDHYLKQIECSECGRVKPRWRITAKSEDYWFCNEACITLYFPEKIDITALTLSELKTELFGPTVNFSDSYSASLGWLNTQRFNSFDY